jgi:hypothetical protein
MAKRKHRQARPGARTPRDPDVFINRRPRPEQSDAENLAALAMEGTASNAIVARLGTTALW